MDGIINFFKPRGMTSHDAVYFFRRLLKTKRVGHTGTLDPNATGVLPICIGKATRISEYLLEVEKEYIGELTLGVSTDTQDLDGKVIDTSDVLVSKEDVENSFSKFRGSISQIPPMYSALKHNGKKLYELAREGKTIERKPRHAEIYKLDILNNEENRKILFYTKCSRGTYIRTLCEDIGADLKTLGHMSYLIRVGVGPFKIEESLSMEYLSSIEPEKIQKLILPVDKGVEYFHELIVPDSLYNRLINGVPLEMNTSEDLSIEKRYRVYSKNQFIGIGRIIEKHNEIYLKMDKVLI